MNENQIKQVCARLWAWDCRPVPTEKQKSLTEHIKLSVMTGVYYPNYYRGECPKCGHDLRVGTVVSHCGACGGEYQNNTLDMESPEIHEWLKVSPRISPLLEAGGVVVKDGEGAYWGRTAGDLYGLLRHFLAAMPHEPWAKGTIKAGSTAAEIKAAVQKGGRLVFEPGVDFAGISCFMGANLTGAVFIRANLKGVNLKRANLEWANLDRANLDGANLDGANMREASLDGANMRGASLDGANMRGASLDGAILDGANMRGASLDGANMNWADLAEVDLSWANLDGANLEWANLEGANLEGASLKGANLKMANLKGANLEWANLEGANLPD